MSADAPLGFGESYRASMIRVAHGRVVLSDAIIALRTEHDLTDAEIDETIADVLNDRIRRRAERERSASES